MRWKYILPVCMSVAMILSGCALPQKNTASTVSNPRVEDGVTTWDKVRFGRYYQEAEFSARPIKWRVLSVDKDNNALLLADKILDAKPYNEEKGDITWEKCTLRKWLNDDFYHEAFNDEEQDIIIETTVVNEDNPYYETEGGGNSTDKVYLLSIDEAANEEYGFHAEFSGEDDTRKAYNTDYVKLNYTRDNTGCGYWILRSPGEKSNNVSYVNGSGGGVGTGYNTDYGKDGIRPVIHIKLSSSLWEKAGVVSSNRHDLKG